jgi:hypothetical protein
VKVFTRTRISQIATVILVVALAAPMFAQSSRLHKRPNVLFSDTVATQFVFPVVGSTAGAEGTFWHSAGVISNFLDRTQRVSLTFLPQGGTPSATVFKTLPAFNDGGDVGYVAEDIVQDLGFTGLGALVVKAVDSNGNLDASAKIDGFTRVWTNQPASTGCSAPTGTTSQAVLPVPVNGLSGAQSSASSVGTRQDANFRANVGVVNLSASSQTFRVNVYGSNGGAESEFRITVPANSMIQQPLPDGNFGTTSVAFTLEGTNTTGVNWAAYATSVDNRTGDSWLRNAVY